MRKYAFMTNAMENLFSRNQVIQSAKNTRNQDVVCHLFTRNQGKVQMRNNKCNSEIVQYKLRSFITKCSNLPYKMFKSLKDELCYLVEIQYYGRVVFTLTYSEYFGSLSAN